MSFKEKTSENTLHIFKLKLFYYFETEIWLFNNVFYIVFKV